LRQTMLAPDLGRKLDEIPKLGRKALQALWEELFGSPPHPKLRRELLIPILIYRTQEKALGGPKPSTERRLRTIAADLATGKNQLSQINPQVGTRLVREWQGKVHEVATVKGGFLYKGQQFRSLSEVARIITGTRWSGPAFFGLKKSKVGKAA
jgi:hypothetical protein